MLTLYVRTGCPYCGKVLREAEEMGVTFILKNISEPEIAAELVARGGKQQVPYLVDEANDKEMYESEDIIAYLHESFKTGE